MPSRRSDSLPAPAERQVLEEIGGAAKPFAVPSPRFALAASIRELNVTLEQLSLETLAGLQEDWNSDWEALTAERNVAHTDAEELICVSRWAAHWTKRLGGNNFNNNKEQQR